MIPFDDGQVVEHAKDCVKYYPNDAGRIGDNCGRMVYDAVDGLGWARARRKQLGELRALWILENPGQQVPGEIPNPNPGSGMVPRPAFPATLADPLNWRGAFLIPNAMPNSPFGDGKRIWTPAFGCYDGPFQQMMLDATLARGYNWFQYQLNGWPYHRDYPELDNDMVRIQLDLIKIKSSGLGTIISIRDDWGDDLSYLKPIADVTQDLVDCVMGIYELNGVVDWSEDRTISILKQQHELWPRAINAFHSTSQDNGGRGFGERPFWERAVAEASVGVYFIQQSAWDEARHTVADTADRASDFLTRVQARDSGRPGGWVSLPSGMVVFEETTTGGYSNGWTEQRCKDKMDAILRQIRLDTSMSPRGFMDGGS